MFMSFFATSLCGGSSTARRPLPRVDPPPKGEIWERFPGDEDFFGVPNAVVWRTRRQAKKFLEKKKKEKEAGEEGEGDDDKHAHAEDGDGDGDGVWDGGDEGDGPGAGEGAPWANRDEGMGVEVAGLEGEGVVGDGSVVGEGEGAVSSGAPRAPPTTQEEYPRDVQRD